MTKYLCTMLLLVGCAVAQVVNPPIGGSISSGTAGQPLVATGASTATSSASSIYASRMAGADVCAQIAAACTAAAGQDVYADFTGSKTCSVANANAMLTSCSSGGNVTLGEFTLYLPLSPTNVATATTPPTAVVIVPNKSNLYGRGRGDKGTIGTTISVCTGTNAPVTGCVAPTTRHQAITSTSVNTASGHTYLGITSSAMDYVAGEPVRIEGSSVKSNNGAWRVCSTSNSNSTFTDSNCPANPTSTTVWVVGAGGLTSASIGGTLTGYSSNPTVSFGAGCATTPTATALETAGTLQSVTIVNPGQGCTSAPTCTLTGGGGAATCSVTIMAACAASCGNVHGELPLVELAPIGNNTFGEAVQNMGIDCNGVVDCVPLRSLTGNEQSRFRDLNLRGSPERQLDIHSFNAQNMGAVDGVSLNAGSITCTVGTEGFFFGDVGPHGLKDFTSDESGCGAVVVNAGGRVSVNSMSDYIMGGHGEDNQYGVIYGQDEPTWNVISLATWGAPSATCGATNCLTTDGAYQNQQSSAVKVVANFPTGTPTTGDYAFHAVKKNTGSILTVADDIKGVYISDNVTTIYGVDKSGAFYSLNTSSPTVPNQFPGGIGTGRTANTDLAGSLTLSGGTQTYAFQNGFSTSTAGAYATAPICWCNNTNQASVTACSASATTSTLTVKSGAGTDTVTYACFSKNF